MLCDFKHPVFRYVAQWTQYLSYQKFSYESIVYNDFNGENFACQESASGCQCIYGPNIGMAQDVTRDLRSTLFMISIVHKCYTLIVKHDLTIESLGDLS